MSKPFALVIEDEKDLVRLFSTIVSTVGFETEEISDGQMALERLAHVSPNLIVLDLHLPNISGIDIIKKVRQDERFNKTRIIVITADIVQAQTVSPQVDYILFKPISAGQLRILARRLYYKINDT